MYVPLSKRSARSSLRTSAAIGSSRIRFQPLNSGGRRERSGGDGGRSLLAAQPTRSTWHTRNAGTKMVRRSSITAYIGRLEHGAQNHQHTHAKNKNDPARHLMRRSRIESGRKRGGPHPDRVGKDRYRYRSDQQS